MNYEEALADILQSVVDAKDFILSQAPTVVQELLMWHMVRSLIFFSVSTIILLIALHLASKAIKTSKLPYEEIVKREGTFVCLCVGGGGGILAGLAFMYHNLEWLQILVAPKLYLVEYAAQLARG